LDELIALGPDGCWSALEIVSMFSQNRSDLPIPIADRVKAILRVEDLLPAAKSGSRDAHLLKSEIERLFKYGLLDGDSAAAVVRLLLTTPDLDSGFRFDFEHYSGDILSATISAHPESVWRELAPRLNDRDPVRKRVLNRLLGRAQEEQFGPAVLFKLPERIYLEWVREKPEERAPIVVQWLPITDQLVENCPSWHPAIERFIAEFGEINGILPKIAARFYPSSFWGSLSSGAKCNPRRH
jgi:hypothetical protein